MTSIKDQLEAYKKCINKIDDYFEYRCKSEQDQEIVHLYLTELTSKLIKPTVPTMQAVHKQFKTKYDVYLVSKIDIDDLKKFLGDEFMNGCLTAKHEFLRIDADLPQLKYIRTYVSTVSIDPRKNFVDVKEVTINLGDYLVLNRGANVLMHYSGIDFLNNFDF